MKIQGIGLKHINNNYKLNLSSKSKNTQFNNISATPLIYPKGYYSNIVFKGADFSQTIEENYFQLPKLKNNKGEVYQAMPDDTQLSSAKSLFNGDNTICIAPTGVGKTAIANYIITKNLEEGKKTYYTTPLKALSNDKYREFCKIYGEENVGLLTGDIKLKKDAPVVIMTTEIYRNMALNQYANPEKDRFKDVSTVVFDEAHYINENERGKIWEESIIFTPKNIQILPLSATVGNAKEFADWIASISEKNTTLVEASHKDRFVPLVYYEYRDGENQRFKPAINAKVNLDKLLESSQKGTLTEREKRGLSILAGDENVNPEDILQKLRSSLYYNIVKDSEFTRLIMDLFALKKENAIEATQLLLDDDTKLLNKNVLDSANSFDSKENYTNLILDLRDENKLPAIIFKFSRGGCDRNTDKLADSIDLTTKEEKEEILKIVEGYKKNKVYLGKAFDINNLTLGIATHHAGLMPGYKKLVEELFSKKLIKVVFATSTLSAGINMPAKTVVITSLERPTDEKDEPEIISVNEFQQMSGRAGRRGIDKIGNVVLYHLGDGENEIAKKFLFKSPDPMISKYEPSYNFLTSFYKKNEDSALLDDIMEDTFLLHQAGEHKPQITKSLKDDIEKLNTVLVDYGYLEKTQKGYKTTPKGNLLTKVHGYNELTLIDAIYNKSLKNLGVNDVAAFAASMVNSGTNFEDDTKDLIDDLLINACEEQKNYNILNICADTLKFNDLLKAKEEGMEIANMSDSVDFFSEYLAYRWLTLIDKGMDSTQAFKMVLRDPKCMNNHKKEYEDFDYYPFGKVYEGDIFGILSQTTDVLKQIINVCEYALDEKNSLDYGDTEYYEKLLEVAQKAVTKMKQTPLYDGMSVA